MDSEKLCLGQILLFAGDFAPENCAFCKGQLLNTYNLNHPLFHVIGTTYGGDGRSNFALPNMQDPEDGGKYIIVVEGKYPPRY